MIESEYLKVVSALNAEISGLLEYMYSDIQFREVVIKHLLSNDAINVYYNSYLLVENSSREFPDKYYTYWSEFAGMLTHKNSYHRNYGINIISNIISEDQSNLFDGIFDCYFDLLTDEKLTTRKYCISSSAKIINARPDLTKCILSKIISSLRLNSNTEKQQNYLNSEFFQVLKSVSPVYINDPLLLEFLNEVKENTHSKKVIKEINDLVKQVYC